MKCFHKKRNGDYICSCKSRLRLRVCMVDYVESRNIKNKLHTSTGPGWYVYKPFKMFLYVTIVQTNQCGKSLH